jgi:hypothetical protein
LSVAPISRGAHLMTDLWILALTVGLFGAAAWFVRLIERM